MNGRQQRSLDWVRPAIPEAFPLGDEAEVFEPELLEAPPTDSLRELIAEVGIPTFHAPTVREEAFWLLQTAAEVEHALMVQYLYALYSIKSGTGTAGLRSVLRPVTVQEMGHLITVQNLLLILGESPYWSRQDLSPQVNLDPIPFRLEPLSRKSLAKYVAAESPVLNEDHPDFEELKAIIKEAEIATMSEIHHVGLLYAHLYWLFLDDSLQGPWKNFPTDLFEVDHPHHLAETDLHLDSGILDRQIVPGEWAASISDFFVDATPNRAAALEAIYRIAGQGEGLFNLAGSHYGKFRDAYRNFASFPQPPYIEVPVDPTLGDQPLTDPEHERNRISNVRTRLWARLFDQRYHILLLCLYHAFSYKRSVAAENEIRSNLRLWARDEMLTGLKLIAQIMTKRRRFEDAGMSGFFAGAPFTLSQTDVSYPADLLLLWQLHKTLNDESLILIAEMLQLPDLTLSEAGCLDELQAISNARTDIIQARIDANG